MAAPKPRNAWQETAAFKTLRRAPWMADANCVSHPDKSVFFVDRGQNATEARRSCAGCSVWRQCLRFAIDNQEQHGIWGGLSLKERNKLRRYHGVRKCESCGLIALYTSQIQKSCDGCERSKSRKRKLSG